MAIVVFVATTWQTMIYYKYMNGQQDLLVKSTEIIEKCSAINDIVENHLSRSDAMYSRNDAVYSRSEVLLARNEALLKFRNLYPKIDYE